MTISASKPFRRLLLPLTGALLGMLCLPASSAGKASQARPQLIAGIQYVVPTHLAGAKVRTPEGVETAIAEDIAKQLKAAPGFVAVTSASSATTLQRGGADLALLTLTKADADRLQGLSAIATGYVAAPMAIMRSDTDIKSWRQLKGRTVCLAEGGRYVGTLAARYGAIEKLFKAPADSLVTLRTGGCDAAVHDHALLEALLKFPEWKKFSARLPVGEQHPLFILASQSNEKSTAIARNAAKRWQGDRFEQLMKSMAQNIAFEVYLDQEAVDCH